MNVQKKRILVADDEALVRESLRLVLEEEGYEVQEAADGREAVETARAKAPDLMILDIDMPDLDGYTVLLLMKSHPLYKSIPVIVFTGRYQGEDFRHHSRALGALFHLSKPVDREDLLAAVTSALFPEEER